MEGLLAYEHLVHVELGHTWTHTTLMHVNMHTRTHTHACTLTHAHTLAHMHTHTPCRYPHMHAYTNTHMFTHHTTDVCVHILFGDYAVDLNLM